MDNELRLGEFVNILLKHLFGLIPASVFHNDDFPVPIGMGVKNSVKISQHSLNVEFFVVDGNYKANEGNNALHQRKLMELEQNVNPVTRSLRIVALLPIMLWRFL